MTDVFNAMKANVDAITELLAANEIENRAESDLDNARSWLTSCQRASKAARAKENESKILLTSAINAGRKAARKAAPNTEPKSIGISAKEALKNLT